MREALVTLLVLGCGAGGAHSTADAQMPDALPDAFIGGAATICDPAFLPMTRADPLSCCLDGKDEWFVSGNGTPLLVHRAHGRACSDDGVTSGCADVCKYGPCGAVVLATYAPPANVFHPTSNPDVCGRQASTLPGIPEAYNSTDVAYPAATTGCPFTSCDATGPVVSLTVDADASAASGTVASAPAGIDLVGGGTATASFPDPSVSLTATPSDAHARAVLSGDCVVTGDYGAPATCPLTLGPDKTVDVAWQCEPGFVCPF
jgi:hypothetical protein